MKNILITTNYNMGIGDLTSRLYSVVNLILHIREYYSDINKILFLIEAEDKNILESILDVEEFKKICNLFLIQNNQNIPFTLGQYIVRYENEIFYRQYSAINNHNVKTDSIGFWDFYTNKEEDNFNIDAEKFDYRDPSTRKSEPIPDPGLLIFNSKFYQNAIEFVEKNLAKDFEVIYYRACNLDIDHAHQFVETLKQKLPIDNKYYVCSDSVYVADLIKKTFNNCVYLNNKAVNGIGVAYNDKEIINELITEMIICSLSKNIHYAGKQVYMSLFLFFAHIVKQIPVIHYK